MIGSIAGDIIGSAYEWNPVKTKDFQLFSDKSNFTDDSVLTIATADAILHNRSYSDVYKEYTRKFPGRGYGEKFIKWANGDSSEPYNSFGNGSAMRVSPIGFLFNDIDKVLEEAKKSAEVTHNHPEGIKGAQATALAIFLARIGKDKDFIKSEIENRFDYDLDRKLEYIRPDYKFNVSCQGSVPESIICFLESNSFEDAIRNAISLGGDADTMACIAGGIAEAYYKEIPKYISDEVHKKLDSELLNVLNKYKHVE